MVEARPFDIYDLLNGSLWGLAAILGSVMLLIALKKVVEGMRHETKQRTLAYNRAIILKIVRTRRLELSTKLLRWDDLALRNLIADMSLEMRGQELDELKALYQKTGYHEDDLGLLEHRRLNKRMRAINRLEKLKLPIPFEQHIRLLHDENATISMIAMVLLLHGHRKRATPYLISFIEQKRYERKGHLFYILQELGRVDRRALYFLFERSHGDADFEEALLISASLSPPMRFDEVIYRKLTPGSSPFVIVWALRALGHYPSEKLLQLMRILYRHSFWAVRLEVARTLSVFTPSLWAGFLPALLEDPNYLVRLEASKLSVSSELYQDTLALKVVQDSNHPSQEIVNYLLSIQDMKEAA